MAGSSLASAASTLLLMLFLIEASHALDPAASARSSVEYWQTVLPSFPLPERLLKQVSPLDSSQALVARYTQMMSSQPAGVQPDMSSLCRTGNLYCNSSQSLLARCTARVVFYGYTFPCAPPPAFFKEKQLSQGSSLAFFRESDLKEGALLSLKDQKDCTSPVGFLPRQLANKLRLASATLLHAAFGIPPSSSLAKESIFTMQSVCKGNAKDRLPGEEAFCAYSLEDLADEIKKRVAADASGASLQLLPVCVAGSTDTVQARLLKVKLEVERTQPYLVCHASTYPFAVNFCHYIPNTRIYSATFNTSFSKIVRHVAICHMDTSKWSPKHVAFSFLHSTPGRTEACHWTNKNGLVFVPTNN